MMIFPLLILRQPFSFQIPGGGPFPFDQKLDHFDSHDNTTFAQFFYNNSDFYDPSRSNFVVFVGSEDSFHENSAALALAEATGARLFSLEHRFFGSSFPKLPLDATTLATYLTVPQVLADLASFVSSFASPGSNVMLVGGFWPGTIASWFRQKYTSLSNSSWASSAPVSVRSDFAEYDRRVPEAINNITGVQTCSDDLQGIYDAAALLLTGNSSQRDEFFRDYQMFNRTQNVTSILYVLADAVAALVQGNKTFGALLKNVCEGRPKLETFAPKLAEILALIGEDGESLDMLSYTNTSWLSKYASRRSWTWLRCNELGWFHTSAGFRSSLVDIAYFEGVCRELFQRQIGVMDDVEFGGTEPAARNMVFSNGLTDPWSSLGVLQGAPGFERVAYAVVGESHCFDFRVGSSTQQAIIRQFRDWEHGISCKNGARVGHSCHCNSISFGGTTCADPKHDQTSFEAIALCAVIVTTILLLIIGASVWVCGKKEEEEDGQVRSRLNAFHTYT